MATARRARFASTVVVLGASVAAVALLLSLAQELTQLRDNPGAVGRHYDLTAALPASATSEVRKLPGVAAAAPRYVTLAADSFQLGESLRVIAYPGRIEDFEAPELQSGRRVRHDDEANVGVTLAQSLGVGLGSTLALQTPGGGEARFKVVGIVRSLELGGRVAYVHPPRLNAADPGLPPLIAVRLKSPGDRARVNRELTAIGARRLARSGGATTRDTHFVGILANVLRVLAVIVALASLQALVQSLSLLARERRGALSLLRSLGAGRSALALLLSGSALAAALPAAVVGLALDALVLGPVAAHAAAPYAALDLTPSPAVTAATAGGMVLLALLSALAAARGATRLAIVRGMREE